MTIPPQIPKLVALAKLINVWCVYGPSFLPTVLPSPKDTLIQGVFKAAPRATYHFTMCNPPFFGNMMEAQGIMSRTMDRPEPKSVSTASEVEMIYEGGEVDFVKRMIVESLKLREQIV